MPSPAIFLDRDGTLNRDDGYVHRPEAFHWLDGALEACARLQAAGYRLVVVTNQSGVGRGRYSERDVLVLHRWMVAAMAARGIVLAGLYYCPHHPGDAHPPYRLSCRCRKPAPGLLLRAARELSLDLARSVMVGDRPSDVAAGRSAGVGRAVLLGAPDLPIPPVAADVPVLRRLADLPALLGCR